MSPYSPIKDNIKKFFTNGAIYQNSIAVSGGSLDSGYANFSANRTTNDFVVKGDELKRNSFLLKAGKKMGKFSVEGNINYITQNVKQSESGLYDALLQTATNIPVERFEYSGNGSHWTTYYNNPYWLRDNRREDLRQEKIAAIVTLGYEFNKHINVSYLGNLRLDSNDDLYFRNKWVDTSCAIWGARDHSVVAEMTSVTDLRRRIYGDLLVNFDYMLTKDLSFKATLGNNIQENKFKTNAAGGQNFAVDGVYNASNVLNPYTSTSTTLDGNSLRALNATSLNRKIGVFANLDFAYGEYLFLNATARNDWSSVFAKGNNSFFYPSVGMAFVPTKAFEGLKNNVLNYVKLSANYTKVGNDSAVGAYAINQTGALGIGYPFGSNSYVQQTAPTVPGISPEFVTTKEATVNLGFFGDRLTLDGSYYVTDTADLISQASTSAASGLSRVTANLGSLQTKGFEIDLGFTPIKSKEARGFRWDNKLNYSHYKSIITKIATGANELSLRQPYSFIGIFAEVGEEFPLIKGTTYLRDDQGRVIVDASGMPSVDPTFKKLGKATPDYILGYNTSFSYRGIKLSATMDYRTGHQFYSDVKRNLAWTGQLVESAENRGGFILPNSTYDYNGDGIYQANENNTNVVTGGTGVGSVISYYDTYASTGENLVIDATAFKLREASLSYSFPESLISKTRLSSLVIGVNARNPLSLFSKENRNYNDPETSENTGNAAGIAFTDRYPTQSSYGFSLNLTF
jgi:outer membrane receptor protein involved in Fe transport